MTEKNLEYKELFKYTEQKLQSHFQNNDDFNKQFAIMEQYYYNKVENIINNDDKNKFQELFFTSVKSQFFNGYYIVREFLYLDPTALKDEFYAQPKGYITEDAAMLMNGLNQNGQIEAIYTESLNDLVKWLITRYENVRELLRQISFEIVCLGATQAIMDEKDSKERMVSGISERGFLGPLTDINFLNPQIYSTSVVYSQGIETWTLHYWSALNKEDDRAGDVSVYMVEVDGYKQYHLNIYLSKNIFSFEREELLRIILAKLMTYRGIGRSQIMVNFAVVEDFYILVQE
ncbi:hypothetical protein [Halobacillus litoralis]|uniref:Uncharacterized protein n=1 Tax=Halobacillus litoralis TaxID=45668 RepID=A0A410MJG1_9BACI|nr:hypothetical protein [Halobacillus litoralis]QAS54795.1 hypothetical protein HLI_21305 [Halobacillus litoralis]